MEWECTACRSQNSDGTRFCGQCGAPALATPLDDGVAGRLPEQRRLVTAIFADLSGFTSLSEQLDPETLSEIVGSVITRLSEVIDHHGGTVLNYAGDAILGGFGIPESAGDDAERALAAALDLRSALAAHLPGLPAVARGLTLHIGVNSGHAIARYSGASKHVAYTVLGDAVNVAQRLEAAAPPDEIYVGGVTAALGGARFVLEPLPPIRMKGKADPVEAWRLVARREHTVRSRAGASLRLVGREAVIDEVVALGSNSAALALVGEPGIGKTSIVLEAARRSAAASWRIGATAPYDAAPYAPWRAVLDHGIGSSLALLEVSDADLGSADIAATRRHAFHRAVLRELAASAPTVVVLDDVQWLDPASVSLARDVVVAIGEGAMVGVSLVLTSRPEGSDTVRQILGRASNSIRQLDGLSTIEVAELLASHLGGSPTARLVDMIDQRTGGSPLFATELLRLLVDRRAVGGNADGWDLIDDGLAASVPPTVEELVQGRLDRLDPTSQSIVELASVIGTTVSVDVLQRASAGPVGADALTPLIAEGILVAGANEATVAFRHGIVREVAYQRTLRGTRRRLHRRVATALEDGAATERVSLSELAHHLYLAEAGSLAADALDAAAREAAAVYANESAIALLGQAIECADGTAVPRLRLRRAAIRLIVGAGVDALAEFEAVAADEAVGNEARHEAMLGIARTRRYRGEFDAALEVLDALTDFDGGSDARGDALRASVLGGAGRPAEAVEASTAGLERGATGEQRVELLIQRSQSYDRLGRADEAFADAVEAETLSASGTNPHQRVTALRILGALQVDHDRLDEAEATLGAAVELADKGGIAFELAGSLVSLAFVRQRRGDLVGAIDLDRRAVDVLRRIQHGFVAGALANLAHKLCDAGEMGEAAQIAYESLHAARRTGDAYAEADAAFALGRVAVASGQYAAAAAELRGALDILRAMGTTLMVEDIEALLREVLESR